VVSPGDYSFRFQAAGYYPLIREVVLEELEMELELAVSLVPRPGTVTLTADRENLRVLLDGQKGYMAGGQEPRYVEIGRLGSDPLELTLSPGRHTITVRRSASVSGSLAVQVRPDLALSVDVTTGPDTVDVRIAP
jgi:hypothetical protein